MFIFQFLGLFSSLFFGHSAFFVEEPPNDEHIVPQDALGHPHPVHFEVGCKSFPKSDTVIVDRPVMGDDEGYHHCTGPLSSPSFPLWSIFCTSDLSLGMPCSCLQLMSLSN